MSELKFIVYDVQHGSCSHVITPANQHIIIDLGSKAETSICRYLKENYFRYGGTIDQLVLTHLHEDHIYDLPNLDTYSINPRILQRPRGAFPLSYKASDPNHYKCIVNKANELNEHYTGVVSDSESPILFPIMVEFILSFLLLLITFVQTTLTVSQTSLLSPMVILRS